MTMSPTQQYFGCSHCWPDAADEAVIASRSLDFAISLIDESHYIVSIKRCRDCGQRYLCIFTERIDWIDGEDPQYRTRLPITADETDTLVDLGEALSGDALNALGAGRRSLCDDFPKGSPRRAFWSTGLFIGPHD
jgi:hypothetical protein